MTNKVGARRRKWEMTIAEMLREWIPGIERIEREYIDRWDKTKRGRVWVFPPLEECRQAFDAESGESWPWDDPDEWLPDTEYESF